VGPIKPRKENNEEKGISVSEGKDYGKGFDKKQDFTNFEVIFN